MLKILKSRVAKYVRPGNYTATHTGKSGFVSTQSRGGTPIPYSFIEEVSSNIYPGVRKYVPLGVRDYTDSYYDLRNKQYKFWYDRWGKPHINKWWKGTLDETLRIKKAYQAQKKNGQFSNSRAFNYRSRSVGKYRNSIHNLIPINLCCRKCILKHRGSRQRPYRKRRSSYGYNYY